jgi:hypothetical protein
MFLFLFDHASNQYLGFNGQLISDVRKALPVEVVYISECLGMLRLKIFINQYITPNNKSITLTNTATDNNIFVIQNKFNGFNSSETQVILSIDNFILGYYDGTICLIKQLDLSRTTPILPPHFCLNQAKTKLQDLFLNGIVVLDLDLSNTDDFKTADHIVKSSEHKRISDLLRVNLCFQRLLAHPIIRFFLQEVFNQEFHLTTFSSNRVNRHTSQRGWHVDYPYHDLVETSFLTELLGIQLLILLNDFTPQNGATEYILGSHSFRRFPNPDDLNECKHLHRQLEAKKGSVVIWLGSLWHTEGLSKVDEMRAALLANFSPMSCKSKDDISSMYTFKDGFDLVDNKIVYSP